MGGGLGALLMMMSSAMNAVPFEKREVFRVNLEEALTKELDENIIDGLPENMARGHIDLRVDYGAEGLLAEVAHRLGIACGTGSAFPVKTSMQVTKTSVKVWYGYGAQEQEIYREEPTKKTDGGKTSGGKNTSDGGRV